MICTTPLQGGMQGRQHFDTCDVYIKEANLYFGLVFCKTKPADRSSFSVMLNGKLCFVPF